MIFTKFIYILEIEDKYRLGMSNICKNDIYGNRL